ncbi:hypothetical protein NWF32_30165 [Pseudomonas qingdaonensis]|nr:hypothetical protein [Pseudomonas qingdaonensis]
MTIEAETLVQLTDALRKRGLTRVSDITFMRAPTGTIIAGPAR